MVRGPRTSLRSMPNAGKIGPPLEALDLAKEGGKIPLERLAAQRMRKPTRKKNGTKISPTGKTYAPRTQYDEMRRRNSSRNNSRRSASAALTSAFDPKLTSFSTRRRLECGMERSMSRRSLLRILAGVADP